MPSPRRVQRRHCASVLRSISPASVSTLRWRDTAGSDMSNGSASSPTVAAPVASRARIARRVGIGQGREGLRERIHI